jgi:endo-1,4-beta-xylanase
MKYLSTFLRSLVMPFKFKQHRARTVAGWLTAAVLVAFLPARSFSQLAEGRRKFVGNIIGDPGNVPANFTQYWNQVTPENAGKWGNVQGSDTSSYNWTPLDEAYNFAISHGFPFKEHNLIWGAQQPLFMQNGTLDSAQQYRAIENWIDSCGHRYQQAAFCDVVNEPIHTPPNGANNTANYIQALGGAGATGWDWVINAFALARKYWSPGTRLLINEYGIINSQSNTAAYLKIIRLLQSRGLIDGIGVQGHSFSVVGTSTSVMRQNLDSLATTGLPIYVSEFDINESNDQTQLQYYQSVFPLLYQFPDVKGITLWGYEEYNIWQTNAYLVTDRLAERPALQWLRQYFDGYLQTTLSSPVDSDGVSRNPLLQWHPSTAASIYRVQVATDSAFATIVVDSTTVDTLLRLDTLAAETKFYWHVLAANSTDTGTYSANPSFTTDDQITGVRRSHNMPLRFTLGQNYPNPFNPATAISYQVSAPANVTLKVFDVLGREVATLVSGEEWTGKYTATFDGSRLPSGVYFYELTEGNLTAVRKLVLIK